MAQPTKDLYIWAEDDIILPTANRPNKKKPQDSLILTGFDQSQKPAADEWNDLLNRITLWLKYIADEKLGTYLEKSENLNDLANKATARINLDVYGKAETFTQAQVNNKQINTGAGLQGGGDLSTNRTISMATPSTVGNGSVNSATNSGSPTHTHALTLTNSNISILTGTVVSGGTIPLPAGYVESQCKWMVSIESQKTALSTDGADDNEYLRCFTTGRTVSVYISNPDAPNTVKESGSANYIIIGVK